jgi:hypothetical protein
MRSLILLLWLGWAVAYALTGAVHVPTTHIDGAFQTASGLYRLDMAQFPGKDFYPYLGIGPLLLLYPLFKVAGANLVASVFAAQFMVLLTSALSVALLWQLIWKPHAFYQSLIAACFLVFASISLLGLFNLSIPLWFEWGIAPGNSLRPMRASIPYLAALIWCLFIESATTRGSKAMRSGVLTGTALLWSNDFAIPTTGMLVLLVLVHAAVRRELNLRTAAWYCLWSIGTALALLLITTLGHPFALLQYNFIDVARDQWWFFGPYGETSRIFSWHQMRRLFNQENLLPLAVLVGTAAVAIRTQRLEHMLLVWLGSVLFSGGVLASVGGHLGGYFGGFYFWGVFVAGLVTLRLTWYAIAYATPSKIRASSRTKAAGLLLLVIASAVAVASVVQNLIDLRSNTRADPNRMYVPELGGYLGREWADYLYLARTTEPKGIYEEYWGIWSALRRIVPSWPVDSVIHALGDTRTRAARDLAGANIIITTSYATTPLWQPWNLSQSYWLYERLLREWEPLLLSPTTVVWHKRATPMAFADVVCDVAGLGRPAVQLQAPAAGFYEVSIRYEFRGQGRFLTLFQNNISFASEAHGYVSVNPAASEATFPAYIEKPGTIVLDARVIGHGPHSFKLRSCQARHVPFSHKEVLPRPAKPGDLLFITDTNWVSGIARHWAGFYVPNSRYYAASYKVGKTVRLSNGETRQISRIDQSGPYLNIFVTGDRIDPDAVDIPSTFTVLP